MKSHVDKFIEMIKNQFIYGGKKYSHDDKKESTDCLFDDFGKQFLFSTMAKYCKRWENLARERDMLKISTYSMITWLKRGFHIDHLRIAPVNTTVSVKAKHFPTWVKKVKRRIWEYETYHIDNIKVTDIYNLLVKLNKRCFSEIKENEILDLTAMCYVIWNREIPAQEKGKDQDVNNKTDRK